MRSPSLGGPDSLDAVEPFLVNLFSDREIIQLPFGRLVQPLFARALSKARGPSVRKNYERIGGRSPQLPLTLAQADALESRLNRGGGATTSRRCTKWTFSLPKRRGRRAFPRWCARRRSTIIRCSSRR